MKLENKKECAIVKDLYIVYDEAEISAESREFVEEHLENCLDCRQYYNEMNQSMQMVEDVKFDKEDTTKTDEEKKIKRSFRKIRRRWIASLLIVALLMPTFSVVYRLTKNQIDGYGLRFTNIDDILLCKEYFQKIKEGNYEEAAKMVDYSSYFIAFRERFFKYQKEAEPFKGTKIELNNATWYAMEGTEEIIENEEAFWKYAIENYLPGILIPEAIMNQYVPELVDYENYTYMVYYVNNEDMETDLGNGKGFAKIETEWGTYYIFNESKTQEITSYSMYGKETTQSIFYYGQKKEITASLLCKTCEFVPEEVFLAANEELVSVEKIAEKDKANAYELYGEIMDAEKPEIEAYFIKKASERLEMFFELGYTIEDISYSDDNQMERYAREDWYDSVEAITITMKNKSGRTEKGLIFLGTKDGKIYILGRGYSKTEGLVDVLFEMIYYSDSVLAFDRLVEKEQSGEKN